MHQEKNYYLTQKNIKIIFGEEFLKIIQNDIVNVFNCHDVSDYLNIFKEKIIPDINVLIHKMFQKRIKKSLEINDFNFKSTTFILRCSFLINKYKSTLKEKGIYNNFLFKIFFLNETRGFLFINDIDVHVNNFFIKNEKNNLLPLNDSKKIFLWNVSMINGSEYFDYLLFAKKGNILFQIIIDHLNLNLEINIEDEILDYDNLSFYLAKQNNEFHELKEIEFSPIYDKNIYKAYSFYIYLYDFYKKNDYEKAYEWISKMIKKSEFKKIKNENIDEEHEFPVYISNKLNVSYIPKLGSKHKWNNRFINNNKWIENILEYLEIWINEKIKNFLLYEEKNLIDNLGLILINEFWWINFEIYNKINENKNEIFKIVKNIFSINLEPKNWSNVNLEGSKIKYINKIYELIDKKIKGWLDEKLGTWKYKKAIKNLELNGSINKEQKEKILKITDYRNEFGHVKYHDFLEKYKNKNINKIIEEYNEIKELIYFLKELKLQK